MSVYTSIIRVCSMVGLALVGPMAELVGTAYSIGIIGTIMAAIGLFSRFAPAYQLVNYKQAENKEVSTAASKSV